MIQDYKPDIAIHPGKTLFDILEAKRMTQLELANRTGLTPKTINEIVNKKNSITSETAIKLSFVFGMSADFWNNLQKNYEQTLARINNAQRFEKEVSLLPKFTCYKELCEYGYIKPQQRKEERVKSLSRFFGVSSLKTISRIHNVAFRRAKRKNLSHESLAAWLRCGELDAAKVETAEFDKEGLLLSINKIKSLSRKSPKEYSSAIKNICADYGVVVVYIPYFRNTFVNGACRWIGKDRALLQLSARGSYDDIFWFTLMHELGHLIKHGKKDEFIEFDNDKMKIASEKEREADEFARNALIPRVEFRKFILNDDFSSDAIKRFASSLNISSSIVAGRLSFESGDWARWSGLRNKIKIVP